MKRVFIFFIFLTCFAANEVWACSCSNMYESPKEAFDKAKAVFISHSPEFVKDKQSYHDKVILKIDKVWERGS